MSESQTSNVNHNIMEEGALVLPQKTFQKWLPVELQDKIWEDVARLSVNDVQDITVRQIDYLRVPNNWNGIYSEDDPDNPIYHKEFKFTYSRVMPPPVLHYCSLSRYHSLKVFIPRFAIINGGTPIYMTPRDWFHVAHCRPGWLNDMPYEVMKDYGQIKFTTVNTWWIGILNRENTQREKAALPAPETTK